MAKRLQSVTLELFGVQRDFEFEPPVPVPGDDDEVSVGRDILEEVNSFNVTLVQGAPAAATVEIRYNLTIDGSVTVDIDLGDEYADLVTCEFDLKELIRQGEFDEVAQAIEYDIERSMDFGDAEVDVEDVAFCDEDGHEYEF